MRSLATRPKCSLKARTEVETLHLEAVSPRESQILRSTPALLVARPGLLLAARGVLRAPALRAPPPLHLTIATGEHASKGVYHCTLAAGLGIYGTCRARCTASWVVAMATRNPATTVKA